MLCGSLLLKIASKPKVRLIWNVLAFYFCSSCYILPPNQANPFDKSGLPENSLIFFHVGGNIIQDISLNLWRAQALEGNAKDDEVVT